MIDRRQLPDGKLELGSAGCTFTYERLSHRGALLVTVAGMDNGQFGTATLDEIRLALLRHRVSVLVGSKAIELTVAVAQHLSQTGNLIQIYTDRTLFTARVDGARQ